MLIPRYPILGAMSGPSSLNSKHFSRSNKRTLRTCNWLHVLFQGKKVSKTRERATDWQTFMHLKEQSNLFRSDVNGVLQEDLCLFSLMLFFILFCHQKQVRAISHLAWDRKNVRVCLSFTVPSHILYRVSCWWICDKEEMSSPCLGKPFLCNFAFSLTRNP